MTYKLWIRCLKGNALIQQAVPVLWCCAGVGWLTVPSANVLPFHGLAKCVQMPVVGKQQLYNGFAQAEWFREQWEAGDAAKSVKTAFQKERAWCWKGRQVSVWERVSVLPWEFLQCLLSCLWFPLLIQGCRQREGNRQSAERARLSEKCFWAAEEKEQRKEILPPAPQKTPPKQPNLCCQHSLRPGAFCRDLFLTAVCCSVSLGTPFLFGVTQHTWLLCSELCQLLDDLLIGWEEGDLLGDTSHSKFLDLDSDLVNPVQKHVLCQGEGGWEEERCCALTEFWSLCVDMGRRHYLQRSQICLFPFLRVTNPDLPKEVKDWAFLHNSCWWCSVGCLWMELKIVSSITELWSYFLVMHYLCRAGECYLLSYMEES